MNTTILIRIKETVMMGLERDGMLSRKGIILGSPAEDCADLNLRNLRNPRLFLFVLFYALVVQPLSAQDPTATYSESTDALYNLDFSTAEHGYEVLTHSYPDN